MQRSLPYNSRGRAQLVPGKMQLISVQLAIDLYMGLGQGKRRAVELNLCLEDIKRGW